MSEPRITQEQFDEYPERFQIFVEECREAGYEPYHYHGRWQWEGPAVKADTVAEVAAATSVGVQSDNMGLRYVVYPR